MCYPARLLMVLPLSFLIFVFQVCRHSSPGPQLPTSSATAPVSMLGPLSQLKWTAIPNQASISLPCLGNQSSGTVFAGLGSSLPVLPLFYSMLALSHHSGCGKRISIGKHLQNAPMLAPDILQPMLPPQPAVGIIVLASWVSLFPWQLLTPCHRELSTF